MEQGSVLSDWVGYGVFVTYLSGPEIDASDPNKAVKGEPEAVTAAFMLEKCGPLGLEVKRGDSPTIFMSWGSVLYVQGPPPEVREKIDAQASG